MLSHSLEFQKVDRYVNGACPLNFLMIEMGVPYSILLGKEVRGHFNIRARALKGANTVFTFKGKSWVTTVFCELRMLTKISNTESFSQYMGIYHGFDYVLMKIEDKVNECFLGL